jgi:hypothetical protein
MKPMQSGAIGRGLIAGLVATIVLSAAMLFRESKGVMPELDPIDMITAVSGTGSRAAGWIGHFVIGTIFWGGGFEIVNPYLPGPYWLRGTIFAVGAWLAIMIVVMPVDGAGRFGFGRGTMVAVTTLLLHVLFGLVMGGVYGVLGKLDRASTATHSR